MARSREQGRKPKAKKEGGKSKKAKAREVKRNLKQCLGEQFLTACLCDQGERNGKGWCTIQLVLHP
jgi:hypothetical protein